MASCRMFLIVDETTQLFIFHLVSFLYIKKSDPVLAENRSQCLLFHIHMFQFTTTVNLIKKQGWILLLWELEVVFDCDRTCQRISLHKSWEPAYFKNNFLVFNEREKSQKNNRNFSTYQQVCSLLHFQSICSPKDDSSTCQN